MTSATRPSIAPTSGNPQLISRMSLTLRHWWIELVSSMEQIIGAAQSTIVGIIIPLLNMLLHPELSATVQGIMGAVGLIGIAVGAAVIGPLSDRQGNLGWFRACAVIVIVGSLITMLSTSPLVISIGLFVTGLGVGGGYSLDSTYISELMPARYKGTMVGMAKASSAIGFLLPAVVAVFVLHVDPHPSAWRWMVGVLTALGLITLAMRIHWAESPRWLLGKGRREEAEKAARFFFGPDAQVMDLPAPAGAAAKVSVSQLFKGENLRRVIYSGIPWACEGLGVYGIGVFIPVLVMALGLEPGHLTGIHKVLNSVEVTAVINFSILPGFVIGLLMVKKWNHASMMTWGFIGSAAGMALLLASYMLHWPMWVSIAAFMFFEITLNLGPHLITYIIPAAIYPVELRGAGSGVADFLGKLGAILGVFFMPMLLRTGGMTLVLIVTIAVMLVGAAVTIIYSRLLKLS